MRDILIILGISVAALGVGAWMFFYGPEQFERVTPNATAPIQMAAEPSPVTPTAVSFSAIDEGTRAAQVSERKNYAAYDSVEFEKLWEMAHGDDGVAIPKVDFTKSYVIGVFMGQQSSGGYSIDVSSVTDARDSRTIDLTLTKPGAGCVVTQSLTRPYQLIVVPVSDNTLSHKDVVTTKECINN